MLLFIIIIDFVVKFNYNNIMNKQIIYLKEGGYDTPTVKPLNK